MLNTNRTIFTQKKDVKKQDQNTNLSAAYKLDEHIYDSRERPALKELLKNISQGNILVVQTLLDVVSTNNELLRVIKSLEKVDANQVVLSIEVLETPPNTHNRAHTQ